MKRIQRLGIVTVLFVLVLGCRTRKWDESGVLSAQNELPSWKVLCVSQSDSSPVQRVEVVVRDARGDTVNPETFRVSVAKVQDSGSRELLHDFVQAQGVVSEESGFAAVFKQGTLTAAEKVERQELPETKGAARLLNLVGDGLVFDGVLTYFDAKIGIDRLEAFCGVVRT